jgi:hypothetical protein
LQSKIHSFAKKNFPAIFYFYFVNWNFGGKKFTLQKSEFTLQRRFSFWKRKIFPSKGKKFGGKNLLGFSNLILIFKINFPDCSADLNANIEMLENVLEPNEREAINLSDSQGSDDVEIPNLEPDGEMLNLLD